MPHTDPVPPPAEKRMTLPEHLEELRTRVLRSVIALGIALVGTMSFQQEIMKIVVWPHEQAMEGVLRQRKVRVIGGDGKEVEGELQAGTVRVVVGEGSSRRVVEGVRVSEEGRLKPFGYPETFLVFFKVSLVAAAALASPVILYQLWRFIGAGLYPTERRLVYLYAPLSLGLFLAGALFGYCILIPVSLRFLAEFGLPLVDPVFNLSQYVSLLFFLTLILGVVFELPLAMHFTARLGLVSASAYAQQRRLAIVLIVIAAAVLTPTGDPYTLLLVAGPMYLLYEMGILLCRLSARPA